MTALDEELMASLEREITQSRDMFDAWTHHAKATMAKNKENHVTTIAQDKGEAQGRVQHCAADNH